MTVATIERRADESSDICLNLFSNIFCRKAVQKSHNLLIADGVDQSLPWKKSDSQVAEIGQIAEVFLQSLKKSLHKIVTDYAPCVRHRAEVLEVVQRDQSPAVQSQGSGALIRGSKVQKQGGTGG